MKIDDIVKAGYEVPFADTGCIKKEWVSLFYNDDPWGFEFDVGIATHSKNWSMGSLNIDLFHLSIQVGRWSWFFARRMVVNPPKKQYVGVISL